jgi:hypothetical protein
MNSRAKGCRGERDAAKAWAEATGSEARRGQQFAGGTESPDVVSSVQGVHLEVKRVERGNPYQWMEQAVRDAQSNVPVVLHRRNSQPWLLVVRLTDVQRLAQAIVAATQSVGGGEVPRAVPDPVLPATGVQDAGPPGVLSVLRRV